MKYGTYFDEEVALKRSLKETQGSLPNYNWRQTSGESNTRMQTILVEEEEGQTLLTVGDIAEIVGQALTGLLTFRGQKAIFTEENQQFVSGIAQEVFEQLSSENSSEGYTYNCVHRAIEEALIQRKAYDIVQSLLGLRAHQRQDSTNHAHNVRIIRRDGQVVPWNPNKIEIAVRKAFLALSLNSDPAVAIASAVTQGIQERGTMFIHIEDVQDLVQETLMRHGYYKVAEAYILYRSYRTQLRVDGQQKVEKTDIARKDLQQESLILVIDEVTKESTFWNPANLQARIEFASIGLNLSLSPRQIETELRRSIYSEMTAEALTKTVILNAKSLMEKDADFAKFAGRILLSYIYEEVLGWDILADGVEGLQRLHTQHFKAYLTRAVAIGRLSNKLLKLDLNKLAQALDYSADLAFDYLGLQTLYDRYLIVDKENKTHKRLETPQFFWMRVAMGLFLQEEKNAEEWIIRLYRLYKNRRFCSSTPTLFNSGTKRSQLSSCYLYKVDDSIESIMIRGIAENAFLSKWAGGLGGSWTAVRGTGGYIRGTNGESQGVIPFLKLHNDQLVAVNQGGKRRGAGCAYLETWHSDVADFLELRRNTGDDRRRTHDMNTANWIPDLFMKRMETREYWTLFNAGEAPDLHELYGKAFEERYQHYEKLAAEGKIYGQKMPAIDLWKKMLSMLFETGHPWITFKDPCNIRSPQDHVGVVHSSNLCTEITLNTNKDETAVCNLGSVILDTHLTSDGSLDHEKLKETITVAIRALDNVIDINFYPTKPAETSNRRHRPIGLGVMGLQNALYIKDIPFASEAAVEFNDEFMEAIAYYAFEASSDLAKERGCYESYKGSKWHRGLLPQDTLELLEVERGLPVEVPRGERMDWGPLRKKIAKQGMRNSNVLAIAPTATISNIMGTTPCIEPAYKNLFVKSNLSGEFIVLNCYLVEDLKKRNLWDTEMLESLKYFDGELEDIERIPEVLKKKYQTAFSIPYQYFIDAAARRQKWIDQSQSVNLFLASPDLKMLSHMYRAAWRAGLKTTYYLRTLGASNIEKATLAVKKQVRGHAGSTSQIDTEAEEKRAACSLEAMMNGGTCEACQ